MTHKEIAERLREIAGYDKPPHRQTRRELTELADTLDPPKPEPGTVVWWRYSTPEDATSWRLGAVHTDGQIYAFDSTAPRLWNHIDYKPARILAPGEVAVTVPPVSEWPAWAECIEWRFIGNDPVKRYEREGTIIIRAKVEAMER